MEAYEKAIEVEPGSAELWSNKGDTLSYLEKYEEALEAYEKAIEIEPESIHAWINKGETLGDLKKYEKALEAYEKAIEIEPEDKRVWVNKGIALGYLKKYEKALEAYEKAIEIEPQDVSAWVNKGIALGHLEKYEESLEAFEKAIEIEPQDVCAWVNKGTVLSYLKKYEGSLEAYEKAVDIEPKNASSWINKGDSLSDLKKYKEALEAYDIAIDIKSESARAWISKGAVLANNFKKYEEALEAFEKAIDIKPEIALAWANKGVVIYHSKKYEEALDAYEKAIKIKPEDVNLWINKGFALGGLKKYKEFLEAFEKAIEIEPEEAEVWISKGVVLANKFKKYEKALEAFEKAIDIEPRNSDAWASKSVVFSSLELYCRALEANTKALVFNPKNKYALINKAITLKKLKKYIEHRETLERAFNTDPNEPFINNLLAEYYLSFGDLKNASKYVENALLIDKKNSYSLGLKGKIKIEEQDYAKSSEYFKKAFSSDIMNPSYLLWNSYAKYLKAELECASDEKKYQDTMLAIIRELEKVDTCVSHEYKNDIKMIPRWLNNSIIYIIELIKRTLIYFSKDEKLTVPLLGKINSLLIKHEKLTVSLLEKIDSILSKLESQKIIAYNYYFLGCFYYKIKDYSTSVYYLRKCKNIKSDSYIEKSAHEALDNIWNNKLRPSIWNWWLDSPSNRRTRRVTFLILILSLFGILLPSVATKIIYYIYDSAFNPFFTYQPVSNFPIIKTVISTTIISLGSFFSSINWQEGAIPLSLLASIIIFVIGSPIIQNFKGSQIEIEIRPPPAFELIPSSIERKLKDLESNNFDNFYLAI